jgi:hypothetical protein
MGAVSMLWMPVQVLEGAGSADAFYRGEVFVGCDNSPLTFGEMMDYCKQSGVFPGDTKFTGEGGGGKTMNSLATNDRLKWTPKYQSFKAVVLEAGAKDFYNPDGPAL